MCLFRETEISYAVASPSREFSKASLSERGIALFEGYAAGISKYLVDTGVDNLAQGEEGCQGEPWVREINLDDALRSAYKTILRASADPFYNELVAAAPPEMLAANPQVANTRYLHCSLNCTQ